MRDTIFLSHGNPEDNDFTRWLALQLTKEGYPVWSDLTNLLGGEDIWKNAEEVIRDRTIKFLFVLSKTSNAKTGPLQELQTAVNVARKESLQNFIIPLKIDDLPHTETNIQLNRLTAISFNNKNWATGLKTLLELLEREGLSKNSSFNVSKVSDWWKTNFDSGHWLKNGSEDYVSNWFEIKNHPNSIYFHAIKNPALNPINFEIEFPFPVYRQDHFLFTFADKKTIQPHIPKPYFINESLEFDLNDFTSGKILKINKTQARNVVTNLLNVGWLRYLQSLELPVYEMSNKRICAYYTKKIIPDGKVKYVNALGKTTTRKIIGGIGVNKIVVPGKEKTVKFWHFGIGSKPMLYPEFAFCIYPHVLFSDDGLTIWSDKKKLHKARRKFCSRWWNAEWRDRILAFIYSISKNKSCIEIEMGSQNPLLVSLEPIRFKSNIVYATPAKIKRDKEIAEEDFDDAENGEVGGE